MQFSIKRQLTVALQNQPGRLAEISQVIASSGLNIEALCVVDNVEQGVIRLLVDQPARCKELLIEDGFYVVEAEVLAINLTDRRGKLAAVTKALATAQINIDYAYSTVDHPEAHTLLVMKVSNIRLAEKVLEELEPAG
ncbi:hypothetical protein ASA1KI_10680 [Opitutales bacterium ASA1]|jgi:hypothetical protein|uniref:ACT domain-containing protein n=1 Tax=Congregicoccus parvus TaxID=3081749 RepID=UPI002B2D3D6C|nr:hypothetical protein ASA1KI_10680 [Opitutales bacterium ASA1]